jgi:hypothetical protein
MGLGGVDKILVVQLSVCQFWQNWHACMPPAAIMPAAPSQQLAQSHRPSQQPAILYMYAAHSIVIDYERHKINLAERATFTDVPHATAAAFVCWLLSEGSSRCQK